MNNHTIYLGSTLEILKNIPDNTISFLVTRLPHAIASNQGGPELDEIEEQTSIRELFAEFHRVVKSHGVIAVFGGDDITSLYIKNADSANYNYDLLWNYEHPHHENLYRGRNIPMRVTEPISIFSDKAPVLFNHPHHFPDWGFHHPDHDHIHCPEGYTHPMEEHGCFAHHFDFPTNLITIPHHEDHFHHSGFGDYPTILLETLLKIYSHRDDTVLVPYCGVGNAGLASINLKRNFVGIEEDPHAFVILRNRLNKRIEKEEGQYLDWQDCREDTTVPMPDDPDSLIPDGGEE